MEASAPRLGAVLFDRDGTLLRDVPYNGDPARVQLMPQARGAPQRLRGLWGICPHVPEDGCSCGKPVPGRIREACRRLRIRPAEAAYVGDIGSDAADLLLAAPGAGS